MMDSLKNDLRLSCMIIVLEIQTFVCMTINLLFIVMAMLLTALLVGGHSGVSVGRAAHRGGQLGHFSLGPSLKGAPGGPMKGPLNTCLKDRYTLYSSEEQCSKLIDKEIWLVMGSYCHCQQVVTFFFFFFFVFFGLHLTTWVKGPTLTLFPGPLNFSGRPCLWVMFMIVSHSHKVCFILLGNQCNHIPVLYFIAHFGTVWKISTLFSFRYHSLKVFNGSTLCITA